MGRPFKYVGGVAVVHHGYLRTTEDIHVLVEPVAVDALVAQASAHDFTVESRRRLRHRPTSVALDLIIAGEAMPRPGAPAYPMPSELASADDDPTIVGLAPLCELKLRSHRHRHLADVVERERSEAKL